jgi:TRAP-type C4-dicarboxylate transport system permease large subunit
MNARVMKQALMDTAILSGKIFIIFAGVYCFGALLGASRLPSLLADFVATLEVNRYVILSIIIAMYIILGTSMNIIPLMLLTLPAIYPTVQALGFDGIWFGVIAVMLMEMGLVTPPVGMIVFTMCSLFPDIRMGTVFKGVLPFVLAMFTGIIIIIIFPGIALWLPNLIFG